MRRPRVADREGRRCFRDSKMIARFAGPSTGASTSTHPEIRRRSIHCETRRSKEHRKGKENKRYSLEDTGSVAEGSEDVDGVTLVRLNDCALDVFVDVGFLGAHEACTHCKSYRRRMWYSSQKNVQKCRSLYLDYLLLAPTAPRARAAARPWPLAIPPEAMKGILSSSAALAMRTRPPMSSSPG